MSLFLMSIPIVGQMVHIVSGTVCYPAIITCVRPEAVDLVLFYESGFGFMVSVPHADVSLILNGTWHELHGDVVDLEHDDKTGLH